MDATAPAPAHGLTYRDKRAPELYHEGKLLRLETTRTIKGNRFQRTGLEKHPCPRAAQLHPGVIPASQ